MSKRMSNIGSQRSVNVGFASDLCLQSVVVERNYQNGSGDIYCLFPLLCLDPSNIPRTLRNLKRAPLSDWLPCWGAFRKVAEDTVD